MRAGNASYLTAEDLPDVIPVFPLENALLLPNGRLPLNIFETRYLAMVDAALGADRLIGMIQPDLGGALRKDGEPALAPVGCIGRIVMFSESGDGRYLIALDGVCRFRIVREPTVKTPYRQCRIAPFVADLDDEQGGDKVDRDALLKALRAFLDANEMEMDWDGIDRTDNANLVNSLSIMAPYGPAEKQALLEAVDLKTRAEMLVAMTEMALARKNADFGSSLQ